MDYDDLDTYNGDPAHDMWVDFDNFENTGIPDVFDIDSCREPVRNSKYQS